MAMAMRSVDQVSSRPSRLRMWLGMRPPGRFVFLYGQVEPGGQKPPGRLDIPAFQHGDGGDAEHEGPGPGPGQIENLVQALPGRVRGNSLAGELGVAFEGSLYVHGKGLGQAQVQHLADHLGPQAVGVHLDGQAKAGQVGQKVGQAGHRGGLAPADHHPVQPAAALAQVDHGPGPGHRGHGVAKGQVRVLAGGAGQIAAREKEHTRGPARPVAHGQGLDAAQLPPGLGQGGAGLALGHIDTGVAGILPGQGAGRRRFRGKKGAGRNDHQGSPG